MGARVTERNRVQALKTTVVNERHPIVSISRFPIIIIITSDFALILNSTRDGRGNFRGEQWKKEKGNLPPL